MKNTILKFYKEIHNDNNHRYRSWEHCYNYFFKDGDKILNNSNILELGSLHLGFYLASWGMYRGSSFLLQKTYTIHKPILKLIFQNKYNCLRNMNFDIIDINGKEIIRLFELKNQIKSTYLELTNDTKNITDTLITKILLGVLGCVPAYDRLFKLGCKIKQITPYTIFNKNSYASIIKFYKKENNQKKINDVQNEIYKKTSLKYPIMKLIDMYFWTIGYENE